MDDIPRSPGGPVHWEDVRPRSILKTDEKKAEKRDAANRHLLDRQRNEITLKILVLGASQTGKTSFIRSLVNAAQGVIGSPASRGGAAAADAPQPTFGIDTTTLLAVALDATPVFWRLVEVSDAYLRAAPPGQLRVLFAGVHAAFVLFDAGEGGSAMASLAGADRSRDELQRRVVQRLSPAALATAGGAPPPFYLVGYCADGVVGAGVRAVDAGAPASSAAALRPSQHRRLVAADTYAAAAASSVGGSRGGGRWAQWTGGPGGDVAGGSADAATGAVAAPAGGQQQQQQQQQRRPKAPPSTAPASARAPPSAPASASSSSPAALAPLDVAEYCYGLSAADLASFATSAGYRAAVFLCTPWLAAGYSGVAGAGAAEAAAGRQGDGSAKKASSKRGAAGGRAAAAATAAAESVDAVLRSAAPSPPGSERHRLTSLAAAQRFRTLLSGVSEDALGYWGYLSGDAAPEVESRAGLPRTGSVGSVASESTQSSGGAGAEGEAPGGAGGPGVRRWYEWRRPWPAALDPPGAR